MCIALLTTSHPRYALILIDNRDEYVLRPTSRPHWWRHHVSGHVVLSSRDLQRRERGTWLGITRQGRFAVLTNYRDPPPSSGGDIEGIGGDMPKAPPVRSRGGIVTSWLGAPDKQNLDEYVEGVLRGGGLEKFGGFSLICGHLKRRKRCSSSQKGNENNNKQEEKEQCGIEPLAIISNRSRALDGVPHIGGERGREWGLSNTVHAEPPTWPKIIRGKKLLAETIQDAATRSLNEDQLLRKLFAVLDTDTFFPAHDPSLTFPEYLLLLRHSIFIPSLTDRDRTQTMREAIAKGKVERQAAFEAIEDESREALDNLPSDDAAAFERGAYGTQRQTVILVDWEGQVTFVERALWDAHGNPIERGRGDVIFRFGIEGWEESG